MSPDGIQDHHVAVIFVRPKNVEDPAPDPANVMQNRTLVLFYYFLGVVACSSDHQAYVSTAITDTGIAMKLIALDRERSPTRRVIHTTDARRGATGKGSAHMRGGQLDAMLSYSASNAFWFIAVGSSDAYIESFVWMIDGQHVDTKIII